MGKQDARSLPGGAQEDLAGELSRPFITIVDGRTLVSHRSTLFVDNKEA